RVLGAHPALEGRPAVATRREVVPLGTGRRHSGYGHGVGPAPFVHAHEFLQLPVHAFHDEASWALRDQQAYCNTWARGYQLEDLHYGRDAVSCPSPGLLQYRWPDRRSEEHTSELQSRFDLVCR